MKFSILLLMAVITDRGRGCQKLLYLCSQPHKWGKQQICGRGSVKSLSVLKKKFCWNTIGFPRERGTSDSIAERGKKWEDHIL